PRGSARCQPMHQPEHAQHSRDISKHRNNRSAQTALPHAVIHEEWNIENVRQRQPYGAELDQAGSSRIKDTPGNIDVGNGVAIKKNGALMVIKDQSANSNYGRNSREQ